MSPLCVQFRAITTMNTLQASHIRNAIVDPITSVSRNQSTTGVIYAMTTYRRCVVVFARLP